MMTEAEAKTKWCPHVRISNGPDGTWNKFDVGVAHPDIYTCIGSGCMAWRFLPQMWRHTSAAGAGTWDEPKETNGYGRKGEKLPRLGFCGLAGAPQ